ncbi:MAG: hypothetical protein BWZ10_02690 [candidate division BRC1 bacterium ADurb.BinA364]|nr:MAG: hypothetical protein BWZ10_02690 [candidate division BRC1 bacterium ADurb.BinA364]
MTPRAPVRVSRFFPFLLYSLISSIGFPDFLYAMRLFSLFVAARWLNGYRVTFVGALGAASVALWAAGIAAIFGEASGGPAGAGIAAS